MKSIVIFIILCIPGILTIMFSKKLAKISLILYRKLWGIEYTDKALKYYRKMTIIVGVILILFVGFIFYQTFLPGNQDFNQKEIGVLNKHKEESKKDITALIFALCMNFIFGTYILFYKKFFSKILIKSSLSCGIIQSDRSMKKYRYMAYGIFLYSLIFTIIVAYFYFNK